MPPRFYAALLASVLASASVASAQQARSWRSIIPEYEPVEVQQLSAELERVYDAPEARQGVAIEGDHFYAVVNTVIAKYEVESGELVTRWIGPRGGLIRHLNSCYAENARLICANSNFPELPQASSVEIYDAATLEHVETHSLGVMDEGSFVWFEGYGEGWIAGFAHYDGVGGVGFKDSTHSGIVTFDRNWRRTGGWMIPQSVQERMSPHAASGGSIGDDGLLYVFGHSAPEMYVLARPSMGPALIHVATIDIDAAGQAFAFDRANPGILYAIDRPTGTVRRFRMPEITVDHPNVRRFDRPLP
jgi:hypothetical protein